MQFGWKKQLAAVGITAAILTIGSLSGTRQLLADVKAAMVQDIDQPARQPFQVDVPVHFGSTPVTIPAGKRLVIDFVAIHGVTTPQIGVQPSILFRSTVAGSAQTDFLVGLTKSQIDSEFFYSGPVKIYADTLIVGCGFGGQAATALDFTVTISGHLVSVP